MDTGSQSMEGASAVSTAPKRRRRRPHSPAAIAREMRVLRQWNQSWHLDKINGRWKDG